MCELQLLSKIATLRPYAAYCIFTYISSKSYLLYEDNTSFSQYLKKLDDYID